MDSGKYFDLDLLLNQKIDGNIKPDSANSHWASLVQKRH